MEAILDALDSYNSKQCRLDLVHYGVGNVTESDVELAEAFNGERQRENGFRGMGNWDGGWRRGNGIRECWWWMSVGWRETKICFLF